MMLHQAQQFLQMIWDLLFPATPQEILTGKRIFRPFLKYQSAWVSHFYQKKLDRKDPWLYLNQYVLPLIQKHASSYHVRGIQLLGLDLPKKPDFEVFQKQFREISNGFEIFPVNKEIDPETYFYLISKRKFPCIETLRPLDEVFCANSPDFWHEAIGHIAPLCFPEVQRFYLEIAELMLYAKKADFENHLAVAWTMTEYGFIKENGQDKMFGAALVGSHLANVRYINNHIAVEPAERNAIISSGFYSEKTALPRNQEGKLRYFCLQDLNAKNLFKVSPSLFKGGD